MENVLIGEKKNRRLPGWAKWLLGWGAVLAVAAGLVYYWRVAFTLAALPAVPLTLAVMGLFSLLYAAFFLLCRLKGDAVCLKAALCVFMLGLLFCFATAPLQAPDEQGHFLRANSLSRGVFVYHYVEDYPEDVDALAHYFPPVLNHRVHYQKAELAPAAIVAYQSQLKAATAKQPQVDTTFLAMTLPFLPQALFMAVARLFGFAALGQMYAGRIANLLVYTVLCYFAFRNAQRCRSVFFAFSLLPVSLFMAASCSYDSLMLACCYFALSVVCKDEVHLRDVVWFGAAVMMANYIKPLNFLLVLLLLMVPKKNWKAKIKPVVVVVCCLAAVFIFSKAMMDPVDNALMRGWPPHDDRPRGSGSGADEGGQLMFMLRYPARFVATALLSIYEADGFLFDLGRLGQMDLVLPLVGGLSLLSLAAAAVLGARKKEDARPVRMVLLCGLALLYCGVVLAAMYYTDTDLGSIRITGQQPRYFLPPFLMLFMVAAMLCGRLFRPRPRLARDGTLQAVNTETLALWIAAAVALLAAVLLFQNYYIGQWVPKSEGGWRLVNLLG